MCSEKRLVGIMTEDKEVEEKKMERYKLVVQSHFGTIMQMEIKISWLEC